MSATLERDMPTPPVTVRPEGTPAGELPPSDFYDWPKMPQGWNLEMARQHAFSMPLENIDVAQPDLFQTNTFWPYFERLRRDDPVHLCRSAGPFGDYWSVTSYEHIMAVDTNHQTYSSDFSNGGIVIGTPPSDFQLPMFIAMDPPRHDVQRKTVQPIVAGENLKNFEKLIRERTEYVLDGLPEGEEFDWVDKVSIELTTMMLATLFDFPFEDRRKLTRWSDVATGRGNPAIVSGEEQWRAELMECLGSFTELWNQRVNNPDAGNDLISMLAHGEDTRNMEPMEYLGNVILLIVGGNDTTRNSMTASIYGMNQFPDEWAKLKADPGKIPNAVAEIIRWQTPLAHMRRTALEDTELGGKQIKKGDKVVMWYVSGNRDDSHFERPNDIWIDRPKVRSHLSFGFGIHRCVGNRLAELQLKILWEEMLKRFESVEPQAEPEFSRSVFVKGYTKLPVIVRRK